MSDNLKFKELVDLTKKLIEKFEKIEGRSWGIEGSMIELNKQVGQLSALVMMEENYYPKDRKKDDSRNLTSKEKIGDELSDLLFMLIRIAEFYKIDLEDAHLKALKEANEYIDSKKL
jgi:uncharacterized protein YabN with tetrapyrrole methylase and pyrophosphatase domain